MKEIVIVDSLIKKYGNFYAVNNISFKVRKGEIFGFLGANGAGKSTTIKILCGIQKIDSGTASVCGFDVNKNQMDIKEKIGYMSQKFTLYDDLSIEENINFFGGIRKISSDRLKMKKEEILSLADLKGKEKILTKELPAGWKQKLALGCSIIHEPEILFLDEPTAGVDPNARRIFWDVIYQLKEKGTTIFITSHYMDEVEQCSNIALMHRGKIAALDSPNNLKKKVIPGIILNLQISGGISLDINSLMKTIPGILRIDPYGNGFHIIIKKDENSHLEHSKTNIRNILSKHKVTINLLDEIPATLEDVFVYLIGELENQNVS